MRLSPDVQSVLEKSLDLPPGQLDRKLEQVVADAEQVVADVIATGACLGERPAAGSVITLAVSVLDERGDRLPAGLDVVVLEVYDDGSILVSADNAAEQDVSAYVHEGEWSQRPEERR